MHKRVHQLKLQSVSDWHALPDVKAADVSHVRSHGGVVVGVEPGPGCHTPAASIWVLIMNRRSLLVKEGQEQQDICRSYSA